MLCRNSGSKNDYSMVRNSYKDKLTVERSKEISLLLCCLHRRLRGLSYAPQMDLQCYMSSMSALSSSFEAPVYWQSVLTFGSHNIRSEIGWTLALNACPANFKEAFYS